MFTPLDRRGFGSLLLSAAGIVIVRPGYGLGATGDPPPPVRTIPVRKSTELDSALASAQPGDHVVLADGTYTGNRTLTRAGTAGAPILVKSANLHGAVIQGTITLAGQHTGVYGLKFAGSQLCVQIAADDTFMLRCWVVGPRGVKVTTQRRVRIGYNRFSGGPVAGLAEGHHIYFRIPNGSTDRLPEGGRIYRNAFASPSGSGASGEFHHIFIGEAGGTITTPSLTDFRIEFNRIEDSIRRRGIYTKRGGHMLFNHIIGRGPGSTGIRHGARGAFLGNRCDNIDVAVINGPEHDVRGNWIRARKGLRLECEHVTASGNRYNAADRALVAGNDCTLHVGFIGAGATLVRPVNGVQIYNHAGSVVMAQQINTNWVQEPRPDMTYPQPITLTPSEVGPEAR